MANKYWWRENNTEQNQSNQNQNKPSGKYWWREAGARDAATKITNQVNKLLQNYNTYIADYQTRFGGRKGGYEDAYVSDSADWLETVKTQKSNFDAEADSIISYMEQYKDYLDADWMESIRKTIAGAIDYQNQIANIAAQDDAYWAGFGTEDMIKDYGSAEEAYNAYVAEEKAYYDKWGHFADAEDFDKTSKNRNHVNPTDEDLSYYDAMMDYTSWRTDVDGKMYDAFGNHIPYVADDKGNIIHPMQNDERYVVSDPLGMFLSTSTDTRDEVVYGGSQTGKKFEVLREGVTNHWEQLKDEEISMYYYILNTQGKDVAMDYLRDTAEKLNARWGSLKAQEINAIDNDFERIVTKGLFGLRAGVDQWGTGVAQVLNGEASPTSGMQYASSEIASSLDGLGKYAYQAANTVGNMLPSILISRGLGMSGLGAGEAGRKIIKGVGAFTMGASAGGNAYGQALKEGYSEGQARTYGTLVGASEALLEYLIGGIGDLGGVGTETLLKKVSAIDKALIRIPTKFGIKIGSEIIEEELQNYLEPAFRSIIFGEDYDAPTFEEFVETAIVTALSTGFLEGGNTIATDMDETRPLTNAGRTIMGAEGGVDALKGLANGVAGVSTGKIQKNLNKQIAAVDKNATSGKVGRLYGAVQNANNLANADANKADIVKSLTRKGIYSETAIDIADALVALYNGQDLTKAQTQLLKAVENDTAVQETVRDIITNEMSTMGQRNQNVRDFQRDLSLGILAKAFNVPAEYKSLEDRVGTQSSFKVSDEGQAADSKTGEGIDLNKAKVTKFVKDKDGKVVDMVIDVDGKQVKASEVDYADGNQSYLFEAVSKIENITPRTATTIIRDYDPASGQTAGEYLNGVDEAFTYGYYSYSEADMNAGKFAPKLTDTQRKTAYELGRRDRSMSDTAADAPVVKMRTAAEAKLTAEEKTAKQKAKIESEDTEVYFRDGKKVVKFDEHTGKYDKKRMAAVNTAKFLSKLGIGGKYYFYESYMKNGVRVYKDTNGKEVEAPNGIYKEADGSIHIDLNAGNAGQGTALFTLAHELTHFVKDQSKKQFKILNDLVAEAFDKTDISMHKRVLAKQKFLESKRGKAVSYAEAHEEVVADALSTMLSDGSFYDLVMEIKVKDKGLFATIKRFFKDMIAKFTKEYENLTPDQQDAQDIRQMKDMFDKIQKAFAEALVEASDNFQATQAQKSTTEEGGVDGEYDIKLSPRMEEAFKPYAKKINSVVNQSISGKGNIDGKAQVKDIMPTGPKITAMVAASSGNAIDISQRNIALSSSDIWHEYKRHTQATAEISRGQIAFTKRQFQNAVKCIISPDIVETIFADTNNPTQRQSFAYAKKTARGHYVVVEAVGGKKNPQIYPVLIVQFSKAKWNKMIDEGKSLGEMLHEGEPQKLLAQDVVKNKKSRVTAAQFASYEAIANTLRSPQLNTKVSQPEASVKEKLSDRDSSYLDAVNRGDMETAKKMVDDVAKRIGYDIKAYHGTNADFFTFDKDRVGKGTDQYGAGFYFASDKDAARHYGNRVIDSVLRMENPFVISSTNLLDAEITLTDEQVYEIVKRHPMMYDPEESPLGDYYDSYWEDGVEDWMIEDLAMQYTDLGYLDSDLFRHYPNELHEAVKDVTGHDGIAVELQNGEKFYVAWFNNQMKSSEPVTYDDSGNVIPLSQRFNKEKDDIRYSDRDSNGNQLSKEQQEYFKDSVVRDANGNLLVVYHGTRKADFTVFKRNVTYFTDNKEMAGSYSPNGDMYEGYLDIKKPYEIDAQGEKWSKIPIDDATKKFLQEYGAGVFKEGGKWRTSPADIVSAIEEVVENGDMDYDGIIIKNIDDTGSYYKDKDNHVATDYIVFNSNQFKNVDNKTPTSDPDIRYSYRGVNKDGIEVYETSEATMKLTWADRVSQYEKMLSTNFVGRTARFKRNGHIYYAQFDPNSAGKVLYGEKGMSKAGKKAIIRAGADGDIFDLVENARYDHSAKDKKNHKAKDGFTDYFDYFYKTVQIDGKVYDININVKKQYGSKHGYTYTIKVADNKTMKASPALAVTQPSKVQGTPSATKITQPTPKVNSQNSGTNSERGEDTSNRSLLANAFEGLSKSSVEYQMIQDYKEQIKVLNLLDEQLSDLNAEIHEIRFTKGKYDAEKLRKLEEKAERIARDINKQDKVLIRMEASEPLRKIIAFERKKAAQKTKEHIAEIQQNKKLRAEQTELRHKIRRTVRDLDKLLNRANKKRNVKEDMQGFVSKALELADYLFTDHISDDDLIRRGITVRMSPQEAALVKETEDILTQIYDNADSLTDEKFTELDAKRKDNERKLRDLLTAQRNERLSTPVYNLFNDLVTEYASLKNSSQEAVKGAYDPKVEEFLRSYLGETADGTDSDRKTMLQNMRLADMTTEELWKLHNAYTMVLHSVRTANKLFVNGKTESLEQMANRIVADFSQRKAPDGKAKTVIRNLSNKLGWDYEKLYYALDRIGSEAFTELVMNLANSENIVMEDVKEAKVFLRDIVKKYDFNNWDYSKEIDRDFLDTTGKKFRMTLGQLMSLYAYSRREGAWDHIEYGGFVFGEAALTNPKPADSYKLSKDQCEAITNTLTKEQKAYVEDMQKFLSETMGAKGNEVSMLLYGIKMFGEKNYFPIHIAGQFKAQANESQAKAAASFGTMTNAGFTHVQNPNAKAPFVLEGFNEIWADHVNEMSRYHGAVPALEDMRRVMNRSSYSEAEADSVAIKQLMENSFGKEAVDYFDNLYREANSGAIRDKLERWPQKMLRLFRKNSVAYSLSVLIQQPTSIIRAYAMIDKKYFGFKGFGTVTSGVAKAVSSKWNPAYANAYNEMLKYAPGVTLAKEIGGFDTHTGSSIREYLLDTEKKFGQKVKTNKYGKVVGLGKALLDKVDDNAIANLPTVADKIAWIEIWNACKRETVAKHKDLAVSSDEFMKIVGERFTEVIRATQVYDSIFAKSPLLKSKHTAVQYLVSFMNEPNTFANMAESTVRDFIRGDWRSGAKKTGALLYGAFAVSAVSAIVYAMRDDDEDETFIEKYVEAVSAKLLDNYNPLTYIPFVRDAWSVLQGYSVERADMAVIADAINALHRVVGNAMKDTDDMTEAQLAEHKAKINDASWKLVESLATFLGIPLKNVRRDILAVYNVCCTVGEDMDGRNSTWNSIADKALDGLIESIPFMKASTKTDKLYGAIVGGDAKYIERIKGTYKTNDSYQSAVRKALRENDPRIHEAAQARYNGNTEEYKRIFREIKNEGKFSFDDIMSAINSEESKIRKGTEPEKATSDYTVGGYVEAIAMGNAADAAAMKGDIIAAKVANGKTQEEAEKEFKSSVTTGIGEAYSSGLLDEAQAEKMLMEYAGKDEEEAASKVSYWSFLDAHPEYDQYDLSESNVGDYLEFAEPAEIPMDVYVQFRDGTKGLAEIKDEWGDVEVTKREQVLEVIDSLPLTRKQKDALYLAAGYSESKIWDVPW